MRRRAVTTHASMRALRIGLATAIVALVVACSHRSTRAWVPDDHDNEQGATQVAAPMASSSAAADDSALIDATWSTRCYVCHGPNGRGDGPNGPMVQAKDLTDPLFQSNRSDAQLIAVISGGKGRMPAFGDLPPKVIAGLVKRIRSLKAGR
jgi:mono/diheme cytochrome c family protein